jgi:hypothetical protein
MPTMKSIDSSCENIVSLLIEHRSTCHLSPETSYRINLVFKAYTNISEVKYEGGKHSIFEKVNYDESE